MHDPMGQAVAAYRAARAVRSDFAPHATEVLQQLEQLGEGGMGVVHRVLDQRLGREAALKLVVDPSSAHSVARFRREAQITARLDHPSIPPVYEGGTTAHGQPYMLMKVIEGRPLKALIADVHEQETLRERLPELLEVLIKVGDAVAYAHEQGVLHRDLKPDNVMVGRFGEVLVIDWGLAREMGKPDLEARDPAPPTAPAAGSDPELTQAGSLLGTPGYMPPEQAGGDELDERADVFALGAILTAVLTGSAPVQGATAMNKVVATLSGKISAPRDRNRDVARDLDAIARHALAAEREERTPSAAAFVADLRAWLAGEEVGCYAYGPLERAARSIRRRPGRAVAAVTAAVALAVVIGLVRELQVRAARTAREREVAAEKLAQAEVEASLREQAAEAEQRRAAAAGEAAQAARKAAQARERAAAAARKSISDLFRVQGSSRDPATQARLAPLVDSALTTFPTPETFQLACEIALRSKLWDRARSLSDRWIREIRSDVSGIRFRISLERDLAIGANQDPKQPVSPWTKRLTQRFREQPDLTHAARWAQYQEATQLARSGAHTRALEVLDRLLELEPTHYPALIQRAQVHLARRQWRRVLRDTARAERIYPHRSEPPYLSGFALDELGLHEEAIYAYSTCLTRAPGFVKARTNRAYVRIKLEDYRAAVADCDRALKLDSDSYEGHNLRGIAKRKLADYAEAIAAHRAALALRPNDPSSLANLATVFSSQGDHARALETYDRIVARLPDDWRGYASRAAALSHLARWDEAIQACDRAIARAGQHPFPLWNKALILSGAGRLPAALEAVNQALALAPNDRSALVVRGRVHLKAGRHAPALADFAACLRLDPNNVSALGWRGIALSRQGKSAPALDLLRRAIARLSADDANRRVFFEALLKLEPR